MVSALAVRKSEFESINSEKITTVLSSAPMLWKPSRIAYADAPAVHERIYAAHIEQIVVDLWTVAALGAPSLYSSAPIAASTLSGVVSPGGIGVVGFCPCAAAAISMAAIVRTSRVSPTLVASPDLGSIFICLSSRKNWGRELQTDISDVALCDGVSRRQKLSGTLCNSRPRKDISRSASRAI
jgi:hypothetical protein